jgi:hypothetical protein
MANAELLLTPFLLSPTTTICGPIEPGYRILNPTGVMRSITEVGTRTLFRTKPSLRALGLDCA